MLRLLFGNDIFISYSRADAAAYAAGLAGALAERGLACHLDQWGSQPGTEVPPEILRALRRSAMLVVVGSEGAAQSAAVEREIREFLPTKRLLVPIDLDGHLRGASWWPLIEGLAVSVAHDGNPNKPSDEV